MPLRIPSAGGLRIALMFSLASAGAATAAPWSGTGADSLNLSILGHYAVDSATGVWSCASYVHANGGEYALLGADSLHIVDLRIPSLPRRAAILDPVGPPETNPYYVSIAVRGDYAYAAGRHGPIRIIDLSNPFLPVMAGEIPASDFCACSCGFPCDDTEQATIETLFIDEDGILYVTGIACGEGFHMYDLSADPVDPPWLCHAHTAPAPGYSHYAHTVYARDGRIIASYSRQSESSPPRWDILDGDPLCPENPGGCGDGEVPRLISTFRHDGEELHAHSAWLLDDADYLLTCDEKRDGHVRVWDVSDLTEPRQIGEFHPDLTCHSVHLAVVKGTTGYAAWYNYGIQVFTLEDPAHPMQIGFYSHPTRWHAGEGDRCCDPTDGSEANCYGVPMIDPFFPSGIFVAVEVDGGLLVGKFAYGPISVAEGAVTASGRSTAGSLRVVGPPGGRTVRVEWQGDAQGGVPVSVPELEIFSSAGRRVVSLYPSRSDSPVHFVYSWDGRDQTGHPVPAGAYFVRPAGSPRGQQQKVILLD